MAGYTRQDTANNISNGSVIDADDFDAEYNAIEAAFNSSTGHSHDGTAGTGAPITKVGPTQDLIVSQNSVLPKATNTLDLGSSNVQFKDAWFDGTVDTDALTVSANATVGGTLGVTGTLTATGGVTGNLTGNVTGTVSDVSNHDTDDIAEGTTNLYHTTARARGAVSATGNLSYNSSTGVFSFTQGNTDTVAEGSTNLYYTTARAQADAKTAISVVDSGGDGSLTYNAGTITYTGPSAAEVRAHFSAGTGVSYSAGQFSIGQAVGTSSNVAFNNVTVGGNLIVNGTTTTVNSNDVNIGDATITLNSDETGVPSQDAGIVIERGTSPNKSFLWDESEDEWSTFGERIKAGSFEGPLTGNVTGNADTATRLATARTIAGKSFDGTANISIAPTDLTGVTATAAEINTLDGITATTAGLNTASTHYVPSGGIIMWSGSIASIPSGWFLCDGANGTPNLRDRFIVGAGSSYAVGATGGADSVTLNSTQIPGHTHTFSGSTNTTGSHTHVEQNYPSNGSGDGVGPGASCCGGTLTNSGVETLAAGDHSHTFSGTTSSTGGGQAHENRPPYYALAYIMKA